VVRESLIPWHRRLALTFAALLLVQVLTGVMLVFREEFSALGLPRANEARPISMLAVENAVRSAYPSFRLEAAQFPSPITRDYVLKLHDSSHKLLLVAVDPTDSSTHELGSIASVLEGLRVFHEDLWLGQSGRAALCLEAICLLFLAISGLILWWPRRTAIFKSMRLPTRGPARTVLFWWHRTLGSILAFLIIPSAVTGSILAVGGFLPSWTPNVTPPRQRAPTDDDRVAVARALFQTLSVREVRFDAASGGIKRIVLREPGVGLRAPITDINFNPATGSIESIVAAQHLKGYDRVWAWGFPIHSAQVGGYCLRALLVATGVVAAGVATLGVGLWWERRPRSAQLASLRSRG